MTINDDHIKFIADNYLHLTLRELSEKLSIKEDTIRRYMTRSGIPIRRRNGTFFKQPQRTNKIKDNSIFNVNKYENWLV